VPDADLYLRHREVIERTIAFVCRRQRLSGADGEDFASVVRLHLLDDDAAVLRAFAGRSSLQTFLAAVVTHQFQDWRNSRWGKWRPSAEAKRMGPVGVRLEELIGREGRTMDDACETLRVNHGITDTRAALEAMAARLPARTRRTLVDDAVLDARPALDSRPDMPLERREAARVGLRAAEVLEAAIGALPTQDRLILRLRFDHDASVASIGRQFSLEQKPLYRRLERLLETLRASLGASGIGPAEARQILDHRGFDAPGGWS
jgi:RNA polymerase sigma factor for flagellar operon FliA